MSDPIREKIIKLVPDTMKCPDCGGQGWYADHDSMGGHNPDTGECETCPIQVQCQRCNLTGVVEPRSITLADVLRAIPNKSIAINSIGTFIWDYEGEVARDAGGYWNLTTDYDGQTQEVKDFIGSLLGVL